MIESLRIENLAIVERAEIEFGPGLNVLTGETGTGKSIVLGALSLLVGGRAVPGSLRDGAGQGVVEALFRTACVPDLEADLVARGLVEGMDPDAASEAELPNGHELVVRRTISSAGRSRARVGGQLVPIATLAELFTGRVEISSQHSSQSLLRPESHGRFLDAAGGLLDQRDAVKSAYDAICALDAELAALREQAEERARRQDFLDFQLGELDEVGLEAGELEALDKEHGRLAHAGLLQAEGAGAAAALQGDERGEGGSALDRFGDAIRALESMLRVDADFGPLLERLRGVDAELRDLADELERQVDRVEADPARLARLEERIAAVERLRRKYGRSEEEIFAYRAELAAERAEIEGSDERIARLLGERADRLTALGDAAGVLSESRVRAGKKLSREAQKALRELAMPDARFVVALEPVAHIGVLPEGVNSGPSGAEAPEFQFSANKGEAPRSLQKVASGGELSRVFLAVKNALRQVGTNMVLVFDEVDAGIGGRAAEKVGRALAELAERHQVICITHLPQIAAFADTHWKVEKGERRGRTRTRVHCVEGDARIEEIARMAGGEQVTEATRQHAIDLMRVKNPE